jgi:hypothetical protein
LLEIDCRFDGRSTTPSLFGNNLPWVMADAARTSRLDAGDDELDDPDGLHPPVNAIAPASTQVLIRT